MAKRKRKRTSEGPEVVDRDGGLGVNFVNTGRVRRPSIASYGDLLDWAQRSGALSDVDAQRLRDAAEERPDDAAAVLRRSQALRRQMDRILVEIVAERPPAPEDLDAFNAELHLVLRVRHLVPTDGGCRWAAGDGSELDRVLWPVVLSAAELFCSQETSQIRRCADPECAAFFVDRSPGTRRKWCDPKRCGHRTRSLRHYHQRVKPMKESIRRELERKRQALLRRARRRRQQREEADEQRESASKL